MTFDEWLEVYFSGTPIDDTITGTMRTAFEAGMHEAGTVGLRDKFAMAAMQGLCASGYYDGQSWDKDLASDAYTAADAMLKERVK